MTTEIRYESVKDVLMEKGLALKAELIKEQVLEDRAVPRWLPPVFPSSAKFQAVVHHVDWQGRLYVTAHPKFSRQKERIDTALQAEHFNTGPDLDIIGWKEGEACVARYSLDGSW